MFASFSGIHYLQGVVGEMFESEGENSALKVQKIKRPVSHNGSEIV